MKMLLQMDFINLVSNRTYRSNMTLINSHTYIVGPCKASVLTSKQSQAFHCNDHDVFDTFLKFIQRWSYVLYLIE